MGLLHTGIWKGIWLSEDKTKMIWVGEEDQLRIISIVHGNDLGVVDNSQRTFDKNVIEWT